MSWSDFVDPAQVIGGFAAGIALAAILIGWWQIQTTQQNAKETDAYRVYTEYLKLCIEYPHISSSDLALKTLSLSDFQAIEKENRPETEQYLWFISYMMTACEKIFDALPERVDWRKAIRMQISYHQATLKVVWPTMAPAYKPLFRRFVEEALNA